jgi:hypothetical protein
VQPTDEQQAVEDAYMTGGPLAVTAGAGTGKTSTLVMLGRARRARARYIAYNKAIATEAEDRFPAWVRCSTSHSLAYAAAGSRWRHRLSSKARVPAREVARILQITEPVKAGERTLAPNKVARLALETLQRFCYSADPEPAGAHVPRKPGLGSPEDMAVLREVLPPLAARAWADACDPAGLLKYEHDWYVKAWQLSDPRIDADVLFVDEAQDLNPVLLWVLRRQPAQIVAVGDSCQQIYGWRGAVDAMGALAGETRLTLSQSFRFGPAIAAEANKWLGLLDAELRLAGNPGRESRIGTAEAPRAILARSNAGVIRQVIAQVQAGRRVAMPSPRPGVPGGGEIRSLALAAISLKEGKGTEHPELMAFQTWAEVQDHAANDPGGEDLAVLVDLVDKHTPQKILALADQLVDERHADVTVSTAHKAKGREWDSVLISPDFRKPGKGPDDWEPPLPSREAMMLNYVAVTRAKVLLDRSGNQWVDDYLGAPAGRSW